MNDLNPHNVAFYIGPIPILWYGIFILLSVIAVTFFCYIEWRKQGYSNYHWIIVWWLGVIFAAFGARWWYLAFNPSQYSGFVSLFLLRDGRAIQGSVVFAILAIYIYIHFFAPDIQMRYVISIIVPNILIGQAIGRWGNFFAQDVYGPTIANLSYMPQFIQNGMFINGAYQQPFFLYESILDLFGWVLIKFGMKNLSYFKPGTHAAAYFVYYGTVRASMELFRNNTYIMRIGWFPTSFFWAIFFIIVGIFLFIYYQYYFDKFHVFWEFKFNSYSKKTLALSLNFIKKVFFIENKDRYQLKKTKILQIYKYNIDKIKDEDVLVYKKYLNRGY